MQFLSAHIAESISSSFCFPSLTCVSVRYHESVSSASLDHTSFPLQILRDKLLYAIRHCSAIDSDSAAVGLPSTPRACTGSRSCSFTMFLCVYVHMSAGIWSSPTCVKTYPVELGRELI